MCIIFAYADCWFSCVVAHNVSCHAKNGFLHNTPRKQDADQLHSKWNIAQLTAYSLLFCCFVM